jgi:hypothetical protein
VGSELVKNAVIAVALAMAGIFVYVWIRYAWQFGMNALLAMIHDVVTTLGLFSLFGLHDLATVAAVLTVATFGERQGGGVRPDPLRDAPLQDHADGRRGQSFGQRDPEPHHGDGRPHLHLGPGAVPIRRRGAARICACAHVGHLHRHLFEHLHRGGRVAEPAAFQDPGDDEGAKEAGKGATRGA